MCHTHVHDFNSCIALGKRENDSLTPVMVNANCKKQQQQQKKVTHDFERHISLDIWVMHAKLQSSTNSALVDTKSKIIC